MAKSNVDQHAYEYLEKLGFERGNARSKSLAQNGHHSVLSYDTLKEGHRCPYLVVVCGKNATPGLFFDLPTPENASEYVAFTDGSTWTWYQSGGDLSNLSSMDSPPAPPVLPGGQRWLEPVPDKKEFKNLLRTMNVALRDSRGGGIVERFDTISKILFSKVFDEREVWQGDKVRYEFRVAKDDTTSSVAKRAESVWSRACARNKSLYQGRPPKLTEDEPALRRIVDALQNISILQTRGDIKGLAYEEILRNTFEKNENQQFFTPPEVVEFIVEMAGPAENESVCDPACGTGGFLVEAFGSSRGGATLVGADVDGRLARVALMNLIMHTADDAAIHHLQGLGSLAPRRQVKRDLPLETFDLILTNPPFGSDLSDEVALNDFVTGRGRKSRRRSVLFTERCLDLLRPGGRLAIVLDDSVLNLPGNSDVRSLIQERSVLEAVVSLPDVTFMPYSTAKSSVLFLRKKTASHAQQTVFMAEAERVGRKPNGDPMYSEERDNEGNRKLLSDLPAIIEAYSSYKNGEKLEHPQCFTTPVSLIDDRLDIYHYHPKRFEAEEELNNSRWPTPSLRELVKIRRESLKPNDVYGDSPVRWLGLGDIEESSGEYEVKIVPGSKIKSVARTFGSGDILFSKLRPNLRKVAMVDSHDEGGVCSGEILVLQPKARPTPGSTVHEGDCGTSIDPKYLAFMLRSDLIYGQLMYRVTGVGRPRVSSETVLSAKLPLPPLKEQQRLVAVFDSARAEAREAKRRASSWMTRSKDIVNAAYAEVIADLSSGEV